MSMLSAKLLLLLAQFVFLIDLLPRALYRIKGFTFRLVEIINVIAFNRPEP